MAARIVWHARHGRPSPAPRPRHANSPWPGNDKARPERQRFTLAHELGHLMLEGRLADGLDEEKACNRFAGAFLAPRVAVITVLVVLLMTWVVAPRLTRWLHPWLHASSK